MHIIAISNQKGGCGKTTTAINLAAGLAHLGKKTLLVDLDPQSHATFGLGVRGDRTDLSVYNVLTEEPQRKKKFLEDILTPVCENLDLAPSHILLSTIEQEFTNKDESVSRLHEVFQTLSFPYDFAVVDCPPSLGFLTFNALRAAHTVIVPVELSSFSLMGVDKLLSMIELIRVKIQHTPSVYALATMVDMRSRLAKHMFAEIQQAFGERILQTVIHQSVSVRESQARGVPSLQHLPRSRGAVDHLSLAQEILRKISPAETQEQTSPRLAESSAGGRGFLRDFTLNLQDAKEVHLVGDFNNWSVSKDSLLWQKESGVWQKRMALEPGRYRYKYVIDGRWTIDPSNDQVESNPYGGMDSVLEIG